MLPAEHIGQESHSHSLQFEDQGRFLLFVVVSCGYERGTVGLCQLGCVNKLWCRSFFSSSLLNIMEFEHFENRSCYGNIISFPLELRSPKYTSRRCRSLPQVRAEGSLVLSEPEAPQHSRVYVRLL